MSITDIKNSKIFSGLVFAGLGPTCSNALLLTGGLSLTLPSHIPSPAKAARGDFFGVWLRDVESAERYMKADAKDL